MLSRSVIRSLKGHTATVRSLLIVDDTTLISGSRDSTICIWDMDSDATDPKLVLKGHAKTVRCLKVHGGVLVSAGYDGESRVWDIYTGQCLRVLKGHTGTLFALCFDGSRIVTGSLDSTIRVWDSRSGFVVSLFISRRDSELTRDPGLVWEFFRATAGLSPGYSYRGILSSLLIMLER